MKVQLQHKRRRDGGVTVGKTRYDLDDRGVVEVDKEHAALMLQGAAWRQVPETGEMPWDEPPPPAPAMVPGAAGRRPRTREELLDVADIAGVPPPDPEGPKAFNAQGQTIKPEEKDQPAETTPDLPPAPADVEPEPEAPEETIEVSMDMTKAQLLAACKQAGITVPKGATKTKILELITQGD